MSPLRWITLAAFALLLAFCGAQELRIAHMQAQFATQEAASSKAHTEALEAAELKERALVAAGAAQGKKDAQDLAAVAADRDRLDRLLRNRPYRPAPRVPGAPSPAGGGGAGEPGATGAQLYAEDGLFLAGESARAEIVRIQRDSCLRQYHDAERQMNGAAK